MSFLYLIIYIFFIIIQNTKTKKPFNSIFDLDFNDLNDDTLKKYKDFDFYYDKQNIISIKEKEKKVSCLNLINKILKDNNELKKKFKEAKMENKEKYKYFINNITDNCINKINKDEINEILNYENVISNKINFNEDLLKINEFYDKFYVEKKVIDENIQSFRIKMFLYFSVVIIVFMILLILIVSSKKKKNEDKDVKNIKSKKKKENRINLL